MGRVIRSANEKNQLAVKTANFFFVEENILMKFLISLLFLSFAFNLSADDTSVTTGVVGDDVVLLTTRTDPETGDSTTTGTIGDEPVNIRVRSSVRFKIQFGTVEDEVVLITSNGEEDND